MMLALIAFIVGAYFGALVMALCGMAHIRDERTDTPEGRKEDQI
jgi:hypothetical protein